MIISLTLSNFRKVVDETMAFTPGLNVLRGENESSKSTRFEAIMYALYGSSALRDPLADVVTWGRKDSELKVSLLIRISGVDYTFTRGKSGAECNWARGKVTGQKEVTKHAAELLGADEKTGSMMMLASQSGIRGALDDGPAKVSELIGRLADFDLLDRVLDTSQKELQLGAEEPLRVRHADTHAALQALVAAAPDPAEIVSASACLDFAKQALASLDTETNEVLLPAYSAASGALDAASATNESHERARQLVATGQQRLADEHVKLAKAEADAALAPDPSLMSGLNQQLADATAHLQAVRLHDIFRGLPAYPATCWEGNLASLQSGIKAADDEAKALSNRVAGLGGEIRALTGNILKVGNCPTCGQSVNGDEHVATKNAELAAKIDAVKLGLVGVTKSMAEAQNYVTALRAVEASGERFNRVAGQIPAMLINDDSVFPPKLSWAGEVPGPAIDTAPINRQIQQAQAATNLAAQAQGRASAHRVTIKEAEQALSSAQSVLAGIPKVDLTPLQAASDAAYATYAAQADKVRVQREAAQGVEQRLSALTLSSATHDERVKAAEARLAELVVEIDTLNFNNAFVKKLKSLKPVITDHLWNNVLAAVSTFFSSMRGEQSVVTKDAKGFRVNGQTSALSGSTLDVLALAIRVALTKTFIPRTSFMILDEPFAACDITRTSSGLGLLQGCGFEQILLASHDAISESVSDTVIPVAL